MGSFQPEMALFCNLPPSPLYRAQGNGGTSSVNQPKADKSAGLRVRHTQGMPPRNPLKLSALRPDSPPFWRVPDFLGLQKNISFLI
jgi:hypothetical protein